MSRTEREPQTEADTEAGREAVRLMARLREPIGRLERVALIRRIEAEACQQGQEGIDVERLREAEAARWDAVWIVDRLRPAIHELRWCKASDLLHAFAHDDTDEDGYRVALLRELRTALTADRDALASEPEEPHG